MKRIFVLLTFVILCIGAFGFNKTFFAKAENEEVLIDEEITITENVKYTKVDFVLDTSVDISNFFVVQNCEVTFEDCTFTATTTDVLTSVIKVAETGKVIFDVVEIQGINYEKFFDNSGKLEIKDSNFVTDRYSIENNSDHNDSIIYYSGKLENVILNKGYISVVESTKIDNTVSVSVPNYANLTLAVKGLGTNVFASKYIDKFEYIDASSTADDKFYFDYIGDYDKESLTIKDVTNNYTLNPGDIVLTQMDMTFTDNDLEKKITYAPMYCTSYNYLKTSKTLYYSAGLTRFLDNYSANTNSSAKFSSKATNAKKITLNVNTVLRGDEDTINSTTTISYLTGGHYAIFVDIPEGYEYKDFEFLQNSETTTLLSVSKSDVLANGCYLRAIVKYNGGSDYTAKTITANVIFEEKINYAHISVDKNGSAINISYPASMVVGTSNTFNVVCPSDEKITSILFNGNSVVLNGENGAYTFEQVVGETNSIVINFKHIIDVLPNPSVKSFQYGDAIILVENYTVAKTGDEIQITYEPNVSLIVGMYDIVAVKSCNNENYEINIISGSKYSITHKIIDLSQFQTIDFEVEYSESLVVEANDFLVEALPSYLSASINLANHDFVLGEQLIKITFVINNSNYVFSTDCDYKQVKLIILASEVEDNDAQFNNDEETYTGSKIEIFVTNYDTSMFEIQYIYYTSVNRTEYVDEAINVGTYTVVAVFYTKSNLYTIDKEMVATLIINPATIDMSNYLESIEVTQYTYDKSYKYIDLKEDSLPDNVTISSVSSEDGKMSRGTYYYTVYFEPVSSNYVCTESQVVALIILPKTISVTLATNNFDYTGSSPVLVPIFDGVLSGDVVNPVYGTALGILPGNYSVDVVSIDNSNYFLNEVTTFNYTINGVQINIDNLVFQDIDVVYDGQRHLPILNGVLPTGVNYIIDNTKDCKNVGVYVVSCTFTSSDPIVEIPEPLTATVNIKKKGLSVSYSEPSNMIANGSAKNIEATISGIVEGDQLQYEIRYSREPIVAGDYSCRVILADEEINYYIINDSDYNFIIFMSSINYIDDEIGLTVEGKFASNDNITINKINDNLKILNLMSKLNVKSYLAYDLSSISYETELKTVNVDSSYVVDNVRYLKIYRVVNNSLQEVDYTISENVISFRSNFNEDIIFVEEYDNVYLYRIHINVIVASAIVCFVSMIIIGIIFEVKRRKFA